MFSVDIEAELLGAQSQFDNPVGVLMAVVSQHTCSAAVHCGYGGQVVSVVS